MKHRFFKLTTLIVIFALLTSATALFLVGCNGFDDSDEDTGTPWEVTDETQKIDDGSKPIKIAVIADPHTLASSQIEDIYEGSSWDDHAYYYDVKQEMFLSEAVLKSAVDNIIEYNPDVVVMLGDLTDDASYVALQTLAAQCARLEAAGITVVTSVGIHDVQTNVAKNYNKTEEVEIQAATKSDFVNLLGDYGFNEAVMRDANSLSYLMDIPNSEYSALVIDTASNFTGNVRALDTCSTPTMSDEQFDWIDRAFQYCQKYGKTPFIVSYFPTNYDAFTFLGKATRAVDYALDNGDEILALAAKYGVTTIFSAHMHMEGTCVHEVNGKNITEITTSCLCGYPNRINLCKLYETGSNHSYVTLKTVNESYVPTYVSAEEKALMTTDLVEYSKTYFKKQFPLQTGKNIYNRTKSEHEVLSVLRMIGLYGYEGQSEESIAACIKNDESIIAWMKELNALPIYGAGNTVQGICEEYDITLPQTNHNGTVYEFILDIVFSMFDGTYVYDKGSDDMKLLECCLKAAIKLVCDKQLMLIFEDVHPDIIGMDMTHLVENALRNNVLDLKTDNLIMCIVSVMVPIIRSSGLNFLANALMSSSTESILTLFSKIMPFLLALMPNFQFFTDESGNFETDAVSISKGEIYITGFTENTLIDIITRTAICSCLLQQSTM